MIASLLKTTIDNYRKVSDPSDLHLIEDDKINIAIYERNLESKLTAYTKQLIHLGFPHFNISTDVQSFDTLFDEHFKTFRHKYNLEHELLKTDIKTLITQFSEICNNSHLKIFFGLVSTDMCRRFHVDMYELRMLCTYEGQGTMWLKEDNINHVALNDFESTEQIALRENDIQQLNTGDVAIIKGALYPNSATGGLVHKSPTIENLNEKRIVLRVDSNSLFDKIQ